MMNTNPPYYPQQQQGGGLPPPQQQPQQQQQQQQQQYGGGGGGSSYAVRSQQAYGQQQQQTPQTPQPSYPNPGVPTQSSYTPTYQPNPQPQQPQQPQQPPQQVSYPANAYHPNGALPSNRSMIVNTYNNNMMNDAAKAQQEHAQQLEQEEQERLLANSIRTVQDTSAIMRDAMDRSDLSAVLEHAVILLSELGDVKSSSSSTNVNNNTMANNYANGRLNSTSKNLSPKNYYELHMMAIAELPSLEEFFLSLAQQHHQQQLQLQQLQQHQQQSQMQMQMQMNNTCSMKDLYEIVQYCPKLVPRLYLLICTGSALVRSGEASPKTVLKELIDNVKCVQCPVRGMFLRHYLLQAMRDKLPDDVVSDVESTAAGGGTESGGGVGVRVDPSSGDPSQTTPTNTTTTPNPENGTVQDSYEFVLANFIEMNKLWVRIQHLPENRKTKEIKRKRERERNELRVLVGTNLVRLSELDGVTSSIYGTILLPKILDQIVACRDPLAQAYLMDCIIQVFPDEFHLETMEVILEVCPKLRDKVNIRTILQSIMDRLKIYYDDELLLNDEQDDNDVKTTLMLEAYQMFHDCIKRVFEARGPKISSKEVIRLESSLLDFSLKCYPGRMDYIDTCLEVCALHLRGTGSSSTVVGDNVMDQNVGMPLTLDEPSIQDLEKLLSLPLDTLALGVLDLHHYSGLLACLPPSNQRRIALGLLQSVVSSKTVLAEVNKVEQLLVIISPLLQDAFAAAGQESSVGVDGASATSHFMSVSHLIQLLQSDDLNLQLDLLCLVKDHLSKAGNSSARYTMPPLIFRALDLIDDMLKSLKPIPEEVKDCHNGVEDDGVTANGENEETDAAPDNTDANDGIATSSGDNSSPTDDAITNGSKKGMISSELMSAIIADCRKVFLLIQKILATLKLSSTELCLSLTLKVTIAADRCALLINDYGGNSGDFASIAYEYMTQAFFIYDADINDSKTQMNVITLINGTLLACKSFALRDYDALITKTTQCAARLLKKPDQCKMILLCSHLFYCKDDGDKEVYKNPQRVLECLQRALKIADACTMSSPTNFYLFVDILDFYVYFYEQKNPSITDKFASGLIALISGQIANIGPYNESIVKAKNQFRQILFYIQRKKTDPDSHFNLIVFDQVPP